MGYVYLGWIATLIAFLAWIIYFFNFVVKT